MKTKTSRSRNKRNKNRDYSKYLFKGEKYGKGTLVHAVISEYAKEHPRATAEKLQTVFPRKVVHSTFEVVEPVKKATKGRFFMRPELLIKTANTKVAVTSQWSKNNIESFIEFVKKNLNMRIQHRTYRMAA